MIPSRHIIPNAALIQPKVPHSLPGVRPTNDISIEFEILSKLGVFYIKICLTDHTEISHTSRQLHCHDVFKISLWSV